MKKKKRLSQLRALEIRIHNMEIALVALAHQVSEHLPPPASGTVKNMSTQLFESNTAARGFTDARMITPVVDDE